MSERMLEVGDIVRVISKNVIGILFIIDSPYCQVKIAGCDVPVLASKQDLELVQSEQESEEVTQ